MPHRPAPRRLTGENPSVSRSNNSFPQQFIPIWFYEWCQSYKVVSLTETDHLEERPEPGVPPNFPVSEHRSLSSLLLRILLGEDRCLEWELAAHKWNWEPFLIRLGYVIFHLHLLAELQPNEEMMCASSIPTNLCFPNCIFPFLFFFF